MMNMEAVPYKTIASQRCPNIAMLHKSHHAKIAPVSLSLLSNEIVDDRSDNDRDDLESMNTDHDDRRRHLAEGEIFHS